MLFSCLIAWATGAGPGWSHRGGGRDRPASRVKAKWFSASRSHALGENLASPGTEAQEKGPQ